MVTASLSYLIILLKSKDTVKLYFVLGINEMEYTSVFNVRLGYQQWKRGIRSIVLYPRWNSSHENFQFFSFKENILVCNGNTSDELEGVDNINME